MSVSLIHDEVYYIEQLTKQSKEKREKKKHYLFVRECLYVLNLNPNLHCATVVYRTKETARTTLIQYILCVSAQCSRTANRVRLFCPLFGSVQATL